jgi:predicted dehydrogenase
VSADARITPMSLRTTIVGCGAVAQRLYRKPLQQLEKRGLLRVTTLVDPVREHADTLGEFFPGANYCAGLGDALARSAPELTLILSPAHLHASQAIQALQRDSHVLCEKPMAATEADCARMNDVAAERKRVLAVGMIRRFFPAYAQLTQLIEEEQLGSLVSFEYREGHKFEWDVTTPAAFRSRGEGGTGVLFDIGPHVVDYLTRTFGRLRVLGYADDALAGIESNASLEVESPACRGSIHLSWNYPQANELRVVGTKGEAVLRVGHFDQLAVKKASVFKPQPVTVSFPADVCQPALRRLSPRTYSDAIYCQIVQVVRAIRLQERPAVDGESGKDCVSLLESALSVARPLDAPWLDGAQRDAYRLSHWRRTA